MSGLTLEQYNFFNSLPTYNPDLSYDENLRRGQLAQQEMAKKLLEERPDDQILRDALAKFALLNTTKDYSEPEKTEGSYNFD